MQFHLDGFHPGDPDLGAPDGGAAERATRGLPEEVDVLIIGCGPAGLTLAAQLAAFPDVRTCIVEQKPGPLLRGQADGIACRTVEMFNAFGFSERVLREAYWVNETTFWKSDDARLDAIVRTGRVQDTEDGLSEFPHVILNQARVHEFFLDVMRKASSRMEPCYGWRLRDLRRASEAADPVVAEFESVLEGREGQASAVRARFVVGCDGAHSATRKLLGNELRGESANHAWGVMDILAVTDFPDIRLKSLIQSAGHGSIIVIPREGGYLVRLYVELEALEAGERAAARNMSVDDLIAAAQRILQPYRLEVKEVAWWSVYEIGQRLCERFDDAPPDERATKDPRIFIAGDACHTHSPKAGQGMNVSMQDSFNLGWKLAAVLRKQSAPRLLRTYSAERQAVAAELIDFDREWAQVLSASSKDRDFDATQTQSYFVRHGRYTAGTATHYSPSLVTGDSRHQRLAEGLPIGARFHSAPVVRFADARRLHLGHTVSADGRWRLFVFSDRSNPAEPDSAVSSLCAFLLEARDSPVRRYTRAAENIDAVIDVRAVFQQARQELAPEGLPPLLLPRKGRYGLVDYEKIFCSDRSSGNDIFTLRGIDREHGCMIIVRPDQYVAHVLPLDAYRELTAFFAAFMLERA